MSLEVDPSSPQEQTHHAPWIISLSLSILICNLYLTLSLSPWFDFVAFTEKFLAILLVLVALGQLARRRGPTSIHILLWVSLASVWLLSPLRPLVLSNRIEQIGTERLLVDARTLAEFIGHSEGEKPEVLDGENLLVPASLKALRPKMVRVEQKSVHLLMFVGVSSEEAIVISTDPEIAPGAVNYEKETQSWREFGREH